MTRRSLATLFIVLATVLLSGCAVMSEKECRSADWREQGERDALAGHARSRLLDIREACAKAGVAPVEALYLDGWNRGIVQFCTVENGARWGREGRGYHQSCPPQLERAFLMYYGDGLRVREAERSLERLRNEQLQAQKQLDKAKDESKRRKLREQLRTLDGQLERARDDLDRAESRFRSRH